jgi:hypothetical protein
MLTRRFLVAAALFATVNAATAQAPSANDPVAILNAIYTRAAKGKGDGGGAFIIETKAAKAKYLSKSLVALWAKADAHTPKGDVGPVDFDPVTNSQDPDVKSFKIDAEKLEADKATIAVTITVTATTANPATRSFVMSSRARPETGRSTTSRAPPTAKPGRSARC